MAWNKNLDVDKPPDTGESPSLGASRIRDLKNAICERLTNWIYSFKTDDSETKEGLKKAPLNTGSAPAAEADKIIVYAKDVGGVAELFARDENGNEIQITSGGNIKPGAFNSKCRVYRSSDQSISSGDWTKVQFDVESYDGLNEYSLTNYRFTAQAAGYYLINSHISMAIEAPKVLDVRIYKNGATIINSTVHNSAGSGFRLTNSIVDILSLAADDYIEVWVWHNAGVDRSVKSGTYSHMSIHRLS